MQKLYDISTTYIALLVKQLQYQSLISNRIYIFMTDIRGSISCIPIILSAEHIIPSSACSASLYYSSSDRGGSLHARPLPLPPASIIPTPTSVSTITRARASDIRIFSDISCIFSFDELFRMFKISSEWIGSDCPIRCCSNEIIRIKALSVGPFGINS